MILLEILNTDGTVRSAHYIDYNDLPPQFNPMTNPNHDCLFFRFNFLDR